MAASSWSGSEEMRSDGPAPVATRLPRPYSGPSAMLRPVLAAVLIVAPNLVPLPRRFARTTPLSAPSSVQVGMARDLLGICGAGTGLLHGPPLQAPHVYHARLTLAASGRL